MENYIQRGDMLTLPAPYTLTGGQGALVNAIFGVAVSNAVAGAEVVLGVFGVYDLNKVSALAISVGNVVFWDDTAKLVTTVSVGNTRIGVAVSNSANPSPTVNVRLTGP